MQTEEKLECRKLETYGEYVGFRRFARRLANDMGVVGHIRKVDDNHLEIVMQGKEKQLDLFVDLLLINDGMSQIAYHDICLFEPKHNYTSFEIFPSKSKKFTLISQLENLLKGWV